MTLANAGLYGPEAILGSTGTPATSIPVTVYLHGTTTAAALYTDNTMATGASNPVDTDSYGNLAFYAAPGLYDLSFTVGGVATTKTIVVSPWFTDSGIRVGQIIETAEAALSGSGTLIDGAWMLCDGSAISRTTYAKLFTALGGAGSPWGPGDGSTTFNLPDTRGRTLVGAGSVGTNAQPTVAIGAVGGEQNHVISTAEVGSHTHTDAGHVHDDPNDPAVYVVSSTLGLAAPGDGHTSYLGTNTPSATGYASISTSPAASGHNNMQPYATIQHLIKAI